MYRFESWKRLLACSAWGIVVLLCGVAVAATDLAASASLPPTEPVNAVLGDISFQQRFGRAPRADEEQLRIETHLRYVERYLREHPPAGSSETQLQARDHELDELAHYHRRGRFPTNRVSASRVPILVDQEGVHCAVAFLMKDDIPQETRTEFASRHLYDELLDVRSPLVEQWAQQKGFTRGELAMIQPSYRPMSRPGKAHPWILIAILVATAALGGFVWVNTQPEQPFERAQESAVSRFERNVLKVAGIWGIGTVLSNIYVLLIRSKVYEWPFLVDTPGRRWSPRVDNYDLQVYVAVFAGAVAAAMLVRLARVYAGQDTVVDAEMRRTWARRIGAICLACSIAILLSVCLPFPKSGTRYKTHYPLWITAVSPLVLIDEPSDVRNFRSSPGRTIQIFHSGGEAYIRVDGEKEETRKISF